MAVVWWSRGTLLWSNIIWLLLSVALLSFALYEFSQGNDGLLIALPDTIFYAVFGVATYSIILCFMGLIGVVEQNEAFTILYMVITTFSVLVVLFGGIVILLYANDIAIGTNFDNRLNQAQEAAEGALVDYAIENPSAWNDTQKQFDCCGIAFETFYDDLGVANISNVETGPRCFSQPEKSIVDNFRALYPTEADFNATAQALVESDAFIGTEKAFFCRDALENFLKEQTPTIAGVFAVIVFIQFAGVIAAIRMYWVPYYEGGFMDEDESYALGLPTKTEGVAPDTSAPAAPDMAGKSFLGRVSMRLDRAFTGGGGFSPRGPPPGAMLPFGGASPPGGDEESGGSAPPAAGGAPPGMGGFGAPRAQLPNQGIVGGLRAAGNRVSHRVFGAFGRGPPGGDDEGGGSPSFAGFGAPRGAAAAPGPAGGDDAPAPSAVARGPGRGPKNDVPEPNTNVGGAPARGAPARGGLLNRVSMRVNNALSNLPRFGQGRGPGRGPPGMAGGPGRGPPGGGGPARGPPGGGFGGGPGRGPPGGGFGGSPPAGGFGGSPPDDDDEPEQVNVSVAPTTPPASRGGRGKKEKPPKKEKPKKGGTPLPPAGVPAQAASGPPRGGLLAQIQAGARLKKAETNDRSAPNFDG